MAVLIAYIIKSIIASGILYGWYQVALRNRKLHVYNRFYLLAAVVVSLVLPLTNFRWYDIAPIPIIGAHTAGPQIPLPPTDYTALCCMGLVSLILLTIMFLKIAWVYRLKRRHGHKRLGNVCLIETDIGKAPFSFLNNLFWRSDMSATDGNGEKIFRHEMTHIRQRHTYDKLFTQVIACICWVNPFYWLIQKELNIVHEFMADAAAIEEGDTSSFALMLLQSHNDGRHLDPSHYFFNSPVIRRLNMVAAPNHTTHKFARKFLALPLIALLLVLFSFNIRTVKNDGPATQQTEREQKLLDEKRAKANVGNSMAYTARTYYIRYRYWTL